MKTSFRVSMTGTFDDIIEKTTAALGDEGFGVLTRIDVHQAMKEKLDKEFRPYTILGACNPGLAYRALSSNAEIGLLLPCNVTVEESSPGLFDVRFVNPDFLLNSETFSADETICDVASEARQGLERAAAALANA